MSNIYVLKIAKDNPSIFKVGSVGEIQFDEGWYGYVGSSKTDDFKRVDRHVEISKQEKDTKFWHIDYLLQKDNTTIDGYYASNIATECQIAEDIDLRSIDDFGCSDCECVSHLFFHEEEDIFDSKIQSVFSDHEDNRYISF